MVMDVLSVPETYFWREMDQVRALVDTLIPQYWANHPGKTINIWCAACATGEEPLSIAIALAEAGWFERATFRIYASDASQAALARARAGYYRDRSFRSLPPQLREKYFVEKPGGWQVVRGLHGRIEWSQANLMAAEQIAPFVRSPFVFCRNVFIYFSPKQSRQLFKSLPRACPARLPFHGGVGITGSTDRRIRIAGSGGCFLYVLE